MTNFTTSVVAEIYKAFPDQPDWRFVTGIAEETGEFLEAFNNYVNVGPYSSSDELMAELADVVITSYMTAEVLGIDLVLVIDEVKPVSAFPHMWQYLTELGARTGQFIGAYNRYTGTSRRLGTFGELAVALAHVVLAAFNLADHLEEDLNSAIKIKFEIVNNRGWKER